MTCNCFLNIANCLARACMMHGSVLHPKCSIGHFFHAGRVRLHIVFIEVWDMCLLHGIGMHFFYWDHCPELRKSPLQDQLSYCPQLINRYLAYGGASLFLVILVVLFTSFSSIGITHTVSYAMAVLDGALGTKGSSQERFLDASNSPLPVTPQPASHVKYPPVDEAHEETKGGQISMERSTSEDVNTATPIKSSDGQQHPAAVPCIKDTKIQVTELGDSMDWKQGVGNNSLEEQVCLCIMIYMWSYWFRMSSLCDLQVVSDWCRWSRSIGWTISWQQM